MTAHGTDQAANLAKGKAFCRHAAAMGADVALFPEMWNIGYAPCPADPEGRVKWHALALTQQSEYVTHFQELVGLSQSLSRCHSERPKGAKNLCSA
jgi:predicted amidohydrolase